MIYVEKSAQSLPLTQMVAKDNNIEVIDDGAEIEDKKSNVVISNHKDNFVHRQVLQLPCGRYYAGLPF